MARALRAIGRSDVGILLLDGVEGITEQDTKIAGLILRQGRACILIVNKWDLKEGDIAVLNTVNIPKGSENVELAHQFINFILSKDVQQAEAEQGVDAPVSTKVVLPPEKAKLWTYGADMIAKLSRIDYAKLIDAQSDWVDRWNEIFGM